MQGAVERRSAAPLRLEEQVDDRGKDVSSKRTGSIGLVADLMLESRLAELRRPNDVGLDATLAAIRETDIAIANLEMPLSQRGAPILKHSNLRSNPDIIEDVRDMGFQAVSLANNHMLDYGRLALMDTLEACDQAGVLRTGAGANLAEALEPIWFEVGGKRVAFISVSCTLPPGSEATEDTAGMVPIRILVSLEVDVNLFSEQPGTMPTVHSWTRKDDEAVVLDHIRALRQTADVVIVAVHWGAPAHWLSPFQGRMVEYQQPLGHAFVEAGADVVFGHHSHALNGIEVYEGKPIFYSAGNFIFEEPRVHMEPEALLAQLYLGETLEVSIVPLLIDERGLPELATDDLADWVLTKLEQFSEPFGTRFERQGDRARLVLE